MSVVPSPCPFSYNSACSPLEDAHLESLLFRVSSKFPEVNLMSCVTPKDLRQDCWTGFFYVCFRRCFPLLHLRRSGQAWQLLKDALHLPRAPGEGSPNSYAKSTSPNWRISLQAKFFLSTLTTAVNYKSSSHVWMSVTARRGDTERWRKWNKRTA